MSPRHARASAIPVGTQFTPDLLDLEHLVEAIVRLDGDRDALIAAFWSPPVYRGPSPGVPTARRRALLPLQAAAQYGLIQPRTYEATQLARELATLTGNVLHDAFARHILLDVGGLRVVEGVQQMHADGLPVSSDSLARYLTDQGFPVVEHNTAVNSLRMWLEQAGLFSRRGWNVDMEAKERLLGLGEDTLRILSSLTPEQRAFVEALCQVQPRGWVPASSIRDHAEAVSGLRLGRAAQTRTLLDALRDAGLIEYRTGGTRSGKSASVKTTPLFAADVLTVFLQRTIDTLNPTLTAYYTARPEDIYADLEAQDSHRKGMALEAYVVLLMRLLGLRFVGWRLRGIETGGAEVDALLAGRFGGLPTKWQVQCKHKTGQRAEVRLEDVAKEVGLLPLSGATHILIMTSGRFTPDAVLFAEQITQRTSVPIFLLGGEAFRRVRGDPTALARILRDTAETMLTRVSESGLWHS